MNTEIETKLKTGRRIGRLRKGTDYGLYLMSIPGILLIFIFSYIPMFGIIIAFKNFRYDKGILGSEWIGFKNFEFFFKSQDAFRITRNTIVLNILFIFVTLAVSIAFALILNEIRKKVFIKIYQTIMFFPYFLSWVVVGYILYSILNMDLGFANGILKMFGQEPILWYTEPKYWPAILLFAYIWKNAGYYCIIYYAGLISIDYEYYEAAMIDGASKFQMLRSISIPFLTPLITIMTLLQIGKIFYSDFGMFFHLTRNVGTLYSTTDVIDTYIYRSLRVVGDIGMSSAVGLFQAVVGCLLVVIANYVVGKYNPENSLF